MNEVEIPIQAENILFLLGLISGLFLWGHFIAHQKSQTKPSWKVAAFWLVLMITFLMSWASMASAGLWCDGDMRSGHNASTSYHQCLACHNDEPVPRLVLSPVDRLKLRSEGLFQRFRECWRRGDQGCMNQIANEAARILGGTEKFLKDTWRKSREHAR